MLGLGGDVRSYALGATVVAAGQAATHCVLLGAGLLSRQKTLPSGTCQILAIHLAGDAVDLQSVFFAEADHDIKAHSPVITLRIEYGRILELCDAYPILGRALWLDCLADAAMFREWTATIGQRSARERIAHFLAEMGARHEAIGELRDGGFELPLNQQAIANALGLSLVHLNKSLKTLRDANLVQLQGQRIVFVDRLALEELAGFKGDYLHLDGARLKDRGMSEAAEEATNATAPSASSGMAH